MTWPAGPRNRARAPPGRRLTGSLWWACRIADHAEFETDCGKGAYIRALARDLGRTLGCFGQVAALRRTRVGPFAESDMISLEILAGVAP